MVKKETWCQTIRCRIAVKTLTQGSDTAATHRNVHGHMKAYTPAQAAAIPMAACGMGGMAAGAGAGAAAGMAGTAPDSAMSYSIGMAMGMCMT